ncbi:hypothetical protein A2Z33_04260 [Candidatus Gottesmanbacteria bacterium RBG_16_52_11]|uniref:Type II secretion system protein GspG C-terminal domain-containing protein n=1 Tax=Candidatus Gottesmanbacteria bacterium RBG_16_52_11 TaxID=1798374 RepID=A0A1F5YWP7_9BACT|nr:MAG: hypothetical protein A2Z33_04260 [Candidatus Gottesmanbacteria bacterium RBG_16_52_11]
MRKAGFILNLSRGFTLLEVMVVIAIIGVLIAMVQGSYMASLRKARDARRKSDLTQIAKALETFNHDRGSYPADDGNGLIFGCGDIVTPSLTACDWGDAFEITDASTNVLATYFTELPGDTGSRKYYYDSDGSYYQLYALIENLEDKDINVNAAKQTQYYDHTDCGTAAGDQNCNYGVSSTNALPTDNSHTLTPP